MEITKTELEKLYRENTNATVCEKLGISGLTLTRYLTAFNIPLKGRGASHGTKIKLVDDTKENEND